MRAGDLKLIFTTLHYFPVHYRTLHYFMRQPPAGVRDDGGCHCPLDCGACSERYRCRHAANSGVCAVAGAAEAYVQPLGRWMTVAAVAPRRAAGP